MKVDARTREELVQVGATIRAARERAGLSQAALAARIGMLRENYIRIEKGRLNLTVETLVRVAEGLGARITIDIISPAKMSPTRKRRPSKEMR